jgi:ADP-ribose pyrophosphatase YjhB (NUDIX family)
MTRTDYFDDPNAPKPNSLVPAASAIVVDNKGDILLIRRSDNRLWSIPGGKMEIGESLSEAVVREVQEETGIQTRPIRVIGIYSSPRNVVAYEDGEVRQQFSICFECEPTAGSIQTSDESLEVAFYNEQAIRSMPMSDSIRRRIDDYLANDPQTRFD